MTYIKNGQCLVSDGFTYSKSANHHFKKFKTFSFIRETECKHHFKSQLLRFVFKKVKQIKV